MTSPALAQFYDQSESFKEKGFTKSLHLTKESGVYVLDIFKHSEETMQERLLHRTFLDEREALTAFATERAVLEALADPPPPLAPRPPLKPGEEEEEPMAEPVVVSGAPYDFSPRFVTEDKSKVIWKATKLWTWDWEVQYAEWVSKEIDPAFFSRYGISTDCADVAIGLRWIFARMHGLTAGNTLAASNRLFTQASFKKSWANLPRAQEWHRDQVFMAALDYVMDGAYTKTLMLDSYPIKIQPGIFLPGVHHLQFHSEGAHTMLVKIANPRSGFTAPLQLLQSTLPRKVRDLTWTGYHISKQPDYDGGFLRIRHVIFANGTWSLKPAEEHSDFSEEQFEEEFMSGHAGFSSAVKAHLLGKVDGAKEFTTSLKLLKEGIANRAKAATDGFLACQTLDCRPGTAAYQEWSTPVRDAKLKDLTNLVMGLVRQNLRKTTVKEGWDEFLRSQLRVNNKRYPMKTIIENIVTDRLVGDPRATLEVRWGL